MSMDDPVPSGCCKGAERPKQVWSRLGGYLGKTETYNDIANWSYADLPKVFRRDTRARSFVVKTVKDLQDALSAPNDTLIFVESVMDPYDALAPVMNSSNKGGGPRLRAPRPATPR